MAETDIDRKKLATDLIGALKGAISTYEATVKEIRSRELKKAELCLLCGNEDRPDKCTCVGTALNKNAMLENPGTGGAGPAMAMSEMKKDDEVTKVKVQGSKHVEDKKEPNAEMPSDREIKDDQDDEGSGGKLNKDEMLAGMRNPGKAGKTVAALRSRAVHPATKQGLAEVKHLGQSKIAHNKFMGQLDQALGKGEVGEKPADAVSRRLGDIKNDAAPLPKDRTSRRLADIRSKAKALPMKKTTVEEANKELQGAKSIMSSPVKPGGKVVNPQAMSPGRGPKPVSGTINKSEKLKEILGKCAVCKSDEHVGKC